MPKACVESVTGAQLDILVELWVSRSSLKGLPVFGVSWLSLQISLSKAARAGATPCVLGPNVDK